MTFEFCPFTSYFAERVFWQEIPKSDMYVFFIKTLKKIRVNNSFKLKKKKKYYFRAN